MSDRPLVEARHVSMHFVVADGLLRRVRGRPPETLKAVDDVSLSIHPRETVGLVGESGCGKSTFGRLLLRLYSPTEGEILHNGVNILATTRAPCARCGPRCRSCSRTPIPH